MDKAIIIYQVNNKELPTGLIDNVIKNIKLSYDATYSQGTIEGEKLNINLSNGNNKKITVVLNNNVYEEIENQANSNNVTVVNNKTINKKVYLIYRLKSLAETIKEDIDYYHNLENPGSNVKETTINGKTIYEYDIDGVLNYAYIIDDDSALLIQPLDNSINVEDFLNITLN